MRDFLRGTIGILLQWLLVLAGFVFLAGGWVTCGVGNSTATTVIGGFLVILGIICFAAVAGIRYWLGHIVRIR